MPVCKRHRQAVQNVRQQRARWLVQLAADKRPVHQQTVQARHTAVGRCPSVEFSAKLLAMYLNVLGPAALVYLSVPAVWSSLPNTQELHGEW